MPVAVAEPCLPTCLPACPRLGDDRELLPKLRHNQDRSFLEQAQQGKQEWVCLMEERGTVRDKPMKPQVVAWELGKRLQETPL
jgi:pyruvate dehydrogenase (quinone)